MKRIYKYPIKSISVQMIEMPKGAAVLAVQTQNGVPCIWAEVDPEEPPIKRTFVTYGTGHPIDDGPARHYVDTYQLKDGQLVFHVYTDRIEYPASP